MSTVPLASLVEPSRTALLVVDVQPVFLDDPDPPIEIALTALTRVMEAARLAGVLRVFVRFVRADVPDEAWTALWTEQCGAEFVELVAPESPAAAFLAGFSPVDGDLEVTKDRYSAFLRTGLSDELRAQGIETVIVAGFSTDVCVSCTARDAFQHDFATVTVSDCCAASTPAAHAAALETLDRRFGRVCSSAEILLAWESSTKERAI